MLDTIIAMGTNIKFLFLTLVLNFFNLNAQNLSIDKLNKPTILEFKKQLSDQLKLANEVGLKNKKILISDSDYVLERRLKSRKKVIDSLNLMNKNSFYIFDITGNNYSGEYEETYFVYDDKVLFYRHSMIEKERLIIVEKTLEEIEKENKELFLVLDHFINKNYEKVFNNESIKSNYYITIKNKEKVYFKKIERKKNRTV